MILHHPYVKGDKKEVSDKLVAEMLMLKFTWKYLIIRTLLCVQGSSTYQAGWNLLSLYLGVE